jgi:hypothetical protein
MSDDHLAAIEGVQKILAKADASVDALEEGKREVLRLIAELEAERQETAARRTIELTAASPAGELDKRLNVIEQRERAIARRLEIGRAILAQLETRIDDAREEERAAARQAAYDAARKLHDDATNRIREFCDRVAPEAAEVLRAYAAAEAATAAVNRDLPAGLPRIQSIETERQGSHLPARITERRVQWFLHHGKRIAEVGTVEAFPNQNGSGLWTIYRRSNAIQGDETIGPCTIADFVEETIQKYEPRPLESLSTSMRIPEFAAPPPGLGRPERRLLPASPVPALAAE